MPIANTLTYRFKDPNANTNSEDTWIPVWTFNQGNNGKVILNKDKVELDCDSLTNIGSLINQITQDNGSFWKLVSGPNDRQNGTPGYVPSGKNNNFLYINKNGEAEWILPYYNKITYSVSSTSISVGEAYTNIENYNNNSENNVKQPNFISRNGQSSTDHILNLNNFLYDLSINLTPTSTWENISSTENPMSS